MCVEFQEQPHKWFEHHILTQNLKTLNLWLISFICCLIFTFLSNVGLLTHTYKTKISPSSVSSSIHLGYVPPQAEVLLSTYICVAIVATSTRCEHHLSGRLSIQGDNIFSNHWHWHVPLLSHEGSPEDHLYWIKSNHTNELDIHFNLKS